MNFQGYNAGPEHLSNWVAYDAKQIISRKLS